MVNLERRKKSSGILSEKALAVKEARVDFSGLKEKAKEPLLRYFEKGFYFQTSFTYAAPFDTFMVTIIICICT